MALKQDQCVAELRSDIKKLQEQLKKLQSTTPASDAVEGFDKKGGFDYSVSCGLWISDLINLKLFYKSACIFIKPVYTHQPQRNI